LTPHEIALQFIEHYPHLAEWGKGIDPEYQAYVKKTPILIPLLPISVAKYEWLKA